MFEEEIDIDEMIKSINDFRRDFKIVKKIKMKEEFYNKLAREVQNQVKIVEVLDIHRQPLNKMSDIRIEIDNSIDDDYEIIYE